MMKKLLIVMSLICSQVQSADLIFKNGFENNALVSGNVTSLNSSGLSLRLSFNGIEQTLVITGSGSFVFAQEVPIGASWTVTIISQPTNSCTISNNSGVMTATGFNNVQVTCSDVTITNKWDIMKWDEGSWQ